MKHRFYFSPLTSQSLASMASISCHALQDGQRLGLPVDGLLTQIRLCEKQNFSRTEALDFEVELKKRNVQLKVVVDAERNLIAYMLLAFSRPGRVANIHKICISAPYRRKGIATEMLNNLIQALRARGCMRVQLWVAEQNHTAVNLYNKLQFEKMQSVNDYYGPGRMGLQYMLCLS